MAKKLLFSVTAKDFEIQTFASGGKGGANQNCVNSGVRLVHKLSGARGEARDTRDQVHNRKAAFNRLLQTKEWKAWHKLEVAKRLGQVAAAEEAVEQQMKDRNLRVEFLTDNGWRPMGDSVNG